MVIPQFAPLTNLPSTASIIYINDCYCKNRPPTFGDKRNKATAFDNFCHLFMLTFTGTICIYVYVAK